MITTEKIDERISAYKKELEILEVNHNAMQNRYQAAATQNINRSQQIKGAIAELEFIKSQPNGEQPT